MIELFSKGLIGLFEDGLHDKDRRTSIEAISVFLDHLAATTDAR